MYAQADKDAVEQRIYALVDKYDDEPLIYAQDEREGVEQRIYAS